MADQMIWIGRLTPYWRRKAADHRALLSANEDCEYNAIRELAATWRAAENPDLRISVQLFIAGQREPIASPPSLFDLPHPPNDLSTYLDQVEDAIASRDRYLGKHTGHFHMMKIISVCFGDEPFTNKELYTEGEEMMRWLRPNIKDIQNYMRYLLQQLRDRNSQMVVPVSTGIWRRNFTINEIACL